MISPLNPLLDRSPLAMHRQMIPHLINMIKKRRNTLHRIPHHQKRTSDPLVEFGQYTIALWIMRLDGDNLVAASVVVPIVPGFESRERLDEVPCHTRAASRVGGGVSDLNVGRRGLRPGYLAAAVGKGDGQAAVGGGCFRGREDGWSGVDRWLDAISSVVSLER